jgi:hypothetical protein
VRHDLDISNPSKGFRRACLRRNVERRICTPRAQLNWKSPFHILHPHREPPFKYFKSFGSHCTVLKNLAELQRQGKLEARGEPGIYIGTSYHLKQSGYLIWLPRLRKTVVAEHVLLDETWFPARLDKHVPNACSALPGNTTSQNYHSDLSAVDPPPPSVAHPLCLNFPPLHPPGSIHLPQYHGSVPQPVPSPILSPIPTSTHITAPLTPLSQALFQNLQLHGSILGHHDNMLLMVTHSRRRQPRALLQLLRPRHLRAPQKPPATPKPAFSSMMSPRKTWRYASRNTCTPRKAPSGKVTAPHSIHLLLSLLPLRPSAIHF